MRSSHINSRSSHNVSHWPRLTHALSCLLGRLAFVLLVTLALYVAVGRLLMPLVNDQKAQIEQALSEALQVPVVIGSLEGRWRAFRPLVSLTDLELEFPGVQLERQIISGLDLTLNVAESLWRRQWVIGDVSIEALQLELYETRQGTWAVRGFGSDVGSGAGFDERYLELLLNTDSVELVNSSLILQRVTGQRLRLENIYGSLRNRRGRHELDLMVSLPGEVNPLLFSLTLHGDPRQQPAMEAYVNVRRTNVIGIVELLALDLPVQAEEVRTNAQLWVRHQPQGQDPEQGNVQARLLLDQMQLEFSDGNGQHGQLENLHGDFVFSSGPDIRLHGHDFSFQSGGREWGPGSLSFRLNRESRVMEMALEEVNLAIVSELALGSGRLPGALSDALSTLGPEGYLQNLHLQAELGQESEAGSETGGFSPFQDFSLQAAITDVSVNAWQGAPAGTGINGFLQVGPDSGRVSLDSDEFQIHLPKLFNNPWLYSAASGQVNWQLFEGGFRVYSNPLTVSNDNIRGQVQFELENRRDHSGDLQSELTLLIGVPFKDARYKSDYLPSLSGIRNTMNWVDQAVLDGQVHDSGFIFRGSVLSDPPEGARTVQAFFNVSDASLAFLQDWPELQNTDAYVEVRNNDVDVVSSSAMIADINLQDVNASVRSENGETWLKVQGQGQTDMAAGLDFLRSSPTRNTIGEVLDEWQGSGALDIALTLDIPLNVPEADNLIQVAVDVEDAGLEMQNLALVFSGVNGRINFDSVEGLSAPGIASELFGKPVHTRITTAPSSRGLGNMLHVVSEGQVSTQALGDWPLQPTVVRQLLNFAEGDVPYIADLKIFNEPADGLRQSLEIHSSLTGVALELPAPLQKPADTAADFSLGLEFFDDRRVIHADLEDTLSARLLMQDDTLLGGRLWLGGFSPATAEPSSTWRPQNLVIMGELEAFDYEAWGQISNTVSGESEQSSFLLDRLSLAEVHVGQLNVVGQRLDNIDLNITPAQGGWSLMLANPLLSGVIDIPGTAGEAWRVRLDYLRLPGGEDKETDNEETGHEESAEAATAETPEPTPGPDPLQDVDPSQLPPLDFATNEFSLGEMNLGAWSFVLEPDSEGVRLDNLRIDMNQALIRSAQDPEQGASMYWTYNGGEHRTEFDGFIEMGDLSQVLSTVGYDGHIESSRGSIQAALQWPGSPAAIALPGLEGRVVLGLRDGRFINVSTGSSRLFGVLNVDSVARRLQLDFSDLFDRGFAFDDIDGELEFTGGQVHTVNRLLISGPSSRIRMEGELDLIRQTIVADLLVSVPLSQNLAVVAGLLGAWPIALSAYVATRIFESSGSDITAIAYHVEGPLNNPQAGFADAEDEALEILPEEVLEELQGN